MDAKTTNIVLRACLGFTVGAICGGLGALLALIYDIPPYIALVPTLMLYIMISRAIFKA